jgi:hypothetical protein
LLSEKFTPGHGYSSAVNARQGSIDRLSNVLGPMQAQPRTPQIPHAVTSTLRAASAVSPLAPQLGSSASDPPNARAMHRVIVKAVNEHPDLMADSHWSSVRSYVEKH